MGNISKAWGIVWSTEPVLTAGFLILSAVLALVISAEIWRCYVSRRPVDDKMRLQFYRETMIMLWAFAILCVGAWLLSGRNLAELGFTINWTIGFWGAMAIAVIIIGAQAYEALSAINSAEKRKRLKATQTQHDSAYDLVAPQSRRDYQWYFPLAVTAGITEEVVFRGFLIGFAVLFMPLWAAAIFSIAIFLLGHLYQGVKPALKLFFIASILTLLFVLSGSLIPGIVLHIAVDIFSGVFFYLAQRDDRSDAALALS
ncbi:MAG: CPBP family intramembrane glutamic endopeptidase [Pseudomonadota bacterium]